MITTVPQTILDGTFDNLLADLQTEHDDVLNPLYRSGLQFAIKRIQSAKQATIDASLHA